MVECHKISFVFIARSLFYFIFQISSLQERLREKDEVIRQKGKQLFSAQNDRKRVDLELGELQDHRNIRERKVSVLQEKVNRVEPPFTVTSLIRSPHH